MMWWHKWFIAVSVSVCSVIHPEICIPRPFIFSSPYSAFMTWFKCVQISLGLHRVMIWSIISSMPLLNSYICKNDWWKRKVGLKKVLLYTVQCGNKDWCVGYWFPARTLWVIQSRQELIKILLLKCIQNVLSLQWTDNSGLINKALLLNKTVKDTCLSTYCVPSQFELTTERPHKQTNKQSLGAHPNRLLS